MVCRHVPAGPSQGKVPVKSGKLSDPFMEIGLRWGLLAFSPAFYQPVFVYTCRRLIDLSLIAGVGWYDVRGGFRKDDSVAGLSSDVVDAAVHVILKMMDFHLK